MTDSFRNHTRSLTSPPEQALAILPDDAGDLPQVTRALYVGVGGRARPGSGDAGRPTSPGASSLSYLPAPADDGAALVARITAHNPPGAAAALSTAVAVTHAPPVAAGRLPDLAVAQNSGAHMLNAFSDVTGQGLTFAVSGPGVGVDPVTGAVSISSEALVAGIEVVVSALTSGRVAESRFRLSVVPPAPALEPPAALVAPVLVGSGVIGALVEVVPGQWSGAPEVALQWRADGAAIPGATGTGFVPTAAEDGRDLDCLVTATNAAGVATAVAGPVRVVPAAPVLVPPSLVASPALTGSGVIGAPVEVDPGQWNGAPAPEVAQQWRADGAAIPGATGTGFVPTPDEDGRDLDCLVTATNAAGVATAVAGPVRVMEAAPAVASAIADVTLIEGAAAGRVEAAAHFTGAVLRFAVEGAGAEIDAAGVILLPTGVLLAEEPVVVTATNSGGAATVVFRVSVMAAPALPVAPVAEGVLPDLILEQGSGERTVSAQAGFAGEDLSFALVTAPAGVSIESGSGLLRIPTDALIPTAEVTVRASNAAGSAEQGFALTVRSTVSAFAAPGALGDVKFLYYHAPTWSQQPEGFARLVPATRGRVHSNWSKAQDDGRYRCLARWSASNITRAGALPFSFNARLSKAGSGWSGLKVDVLQPSAGVRNLEISQYSGGDTNATTVATASVGWQWDAWYWVEVELDGTSVKARLYPEADAAPDWQVAGTVTYTTRGAFGPGSFPLPTGGPNIDIKRLEFVPLIQGSESVPPAAKDADWSLGQFTESK